MIRYFLLVTALLLSFSAVSFAAESTSEPVPQEMQGRWDFPNCQFGELYYTISKHFTMRADRAAPFIERIVKFEKTRDHYSVQDNRKTYVVMPNKDSTKFDMLYLSDDDPKVQKQFQKDPAGMKSDAVVSLAYAHCDKQKLPDWEPMDGVRLNIMPLLDAALDACGDKVIMGNAPCQRAIFDGFDTDHSGSLDYHELMQAYIRLAFIVGAASCNFPIAYKHERMERNAVLFASEALSFLDQDKSGSVSPEEATALNNITLGSFSYGFLQELKTLYTILPFLPASAPHYTCVSCGVPAGGGCVACAAAQKK